MRTVQAALALAAVAAVAAPMLGQSGTLVVLNKSEGTVSIVNLATKTTASTLPTGESPHEVAISPDGKTAVVSNYGGTVPGSTLTVIDLPTAQVTHTVHLGPHKRPHGLAWMPDGQNVLVTAEQDSSLLIVRVASDSIVKVIHTGQNTSHMVVLSPDARRAYLANIGSSTVSAIDLESGATLSVVSLPEGPEGIAINPNGREIWVASRKANRLSVLNTNPLDTVATMEATEFPIRVAFTADGKRVLVTCARSSDLRIFDAASRKEVKSVKVRVARSFFTGGKEAAGYETSVVPIGVALTPDGKTAFVSSAAVDVVTVVNVDKGSITGYLQAGHEPDGVAYSPVATVGK